MFLVTDKLFPVDTLLTIKFTLPEFAGALHGSVRVAWGNYPEWRKKDSMSCGLGLQFENPSQTFKVALQCFLDSLKDESSNCDVLAKTG